MIRPSVKQQREAEQAQKAQQSRWPDEPEATTSASGGDQLPASMDVDDLPQAEAGASDSRNWYTWPIQEELEEANKKLSEENKRLQKALGQCSSSTPVPGSDRPKELKVVYKHVATCEPP